MNQGLAASSTSLRRSTLPFGVSGKAGTKLGEHEDRPGQHVAGQLAHQCLAQAGCRPSLGTGGRHAGGQRHVSIEPLRHAAALDGHDHRLAHIRQSQQIAFNVGQFDTVTVQLDLPVAPPVEIEQSIFIKMPDVAGAISALAVQLEKSGFRQVRLPDVTRADVRTSNDDLAALARRQLFSFFIVDFDGAGRHRMTDRQRAFACEDFASDPHARSGDRGFGGTVGIPDFRFGKTLDQLPRRAGI